jgi:penicillin G amidase
MALFPETNRFSPHKKGNPPMEKPKALSSIGGKYLQTPKANRHIREHLGSANDNRSGEAFQKRRIHFSATKLRWWSGALVLLLAVATGAGFLQLRTSLPQTSGTVAVPGLEHPVTVTRDRYGIPTIVAQSEHDADFALGFVHAQDRLFSMDMIRRSGAGRLSEIFGVRTLGIDETMRTLGLYRAAEAEWEREPPRVRASFEAYAHGVNAYLAVRSGALPPEYYLLNASPEPWRPTDSLVWGKIMDLDGNFRGELARARLLTRVPMSDLAVLYPSYPKEAPVSLANLRVELRRLPLDRLWAVLPPGIGRRGKSNNWVVNGAHSQSGKPLLANDPHLAYSAPGVWYLARIKTPALDLAGATLPGMPFVIIGHNDNIAWGFTSTGGDDEDLFIERLDPANPAEYETETGPRPFVTREERIKVRGGTPVILHVRATRHGPVISDLAGYKVGDDMLALEATWLDGDDQTPQAIWQLDRATNWAEFRDAARHWLAPEQNIVYADTGGNIGFMAPARLPIRKAGDGWLPEPGWTGAFDWIGWVPLDGLPAAYNPPVGRIVTANNKIVPDDYPYFITRDWELPYRAARIDALLDGTPVQSPEASAAIQGDDISLSARTLLPVMLEAKPHDKEAPDLFDKLRHWNARMDRGAMEPLLFSAWMRALMRAVLEPRLGPMFETFWTERPDILYLVLTAQRGWCGDNGDCAGILADSFDRAVAALRQCYGDDVSRWHWGRAHRANFQSPVWASVPVLSGWFSAAAGANGSDDTVDTGGMFFGEEPDPYLDLYGPSLRMIVDLAAPNAARFINAPGQSGNPLSPHWGDLVERWRALRYVSFGNDASGGVLRLVPR